VIKLNKRKYIAASDGRKSNIAGHLAQELGGDIQNLVPFDQSRFNKDSYANTNLLSDGNPKLTSEKSNFDFDRNGQFTHHGGGYWASGPFRNGH
jgi:hypothetical protein